MSVSVQTVVLMALAGAAAQVAAFFLNNLKPIREFPGKNHLFLRMTALVTSVPLLVAMLTDADKNDALTVVGQSRVLCWIAVGGVAIGLLYDAGQLVRALRKEKLRDDQALAGAAAVRYAPQTRQDLLAEARRQVRQRLKYAYGEQTLINLAMQPDQAAVEGGEIAGDIFLVPQPKQQIENFKDKRIRLTEPEKSIVETFDDEDIAGQLLILGAPGSGKTTTLLKLAESLLKRAEGSVEIPYIFELSTWQDTQQDIAGWLMAQLKFEHNIDEAVSRQWMADGHLLPLLDGLDEVDSTRQQDCVEKINAFVTGKLGRQVVVCCRARVYDQIVKQGGEKLDSLNGALRLQPLEIEQVNAYFGKMERADILLALQDEEGLGALLQPCGDDDAALLSIPLFLQIVAIAYEPGENITTKSALLDAYIARRLSVVQRKEDRQLAKNKKLKIQWAYEEVTQAPEIEKTKRYLSWLANTLNDNAIPNVFLIEQMQPKWISSSVQRWLYRLIWGLIWGLIVGLIVGLIGGLIVGLIWGLIGGLIVGLIGGLEDIKPVETFDFSFSRFARKKFFNNLIGGLILGLIGGLILGLIGGLIEALKEDFKTRKKPNQGIAASVKNIPMVAAVTYPAALALQFTLQQALTSGEASLISCLVPAIGWALLFSLDSIEAVLKHYLLRIFLYRGGHIPFDYVRFLRYTTERRLTQQVGGSFRFIHRELLDHFDPEKSS